MTTQLSELQFYFKKCSDCALHPEYTARLHALLDQPLTQELVDYLCEKAASAKHWPELRFAHLRILLLAGSAAAAWGCECTISAAMPSMPRKAKCSRS